tara:strand:+ start:4105 stop:4344 length:240 start_codon:yes stop_codon:yes gene_type:complete
MNMMWSALLMICALDDNGQLTFECQTTVSAMVWRTEDACMQSVAQGMTMSLNLGPKAAVRDYHCHEWERQRHDPSTTNM